MVGRTVGKYRVVGRIGRGATGIVYKAVDETLDREVAIKVLIPDQANTDIVKRFRSEATTLARMNHPEIAVIHELLESDTDLLMVMELVRGETLEDLSERLGPIPPKHAADLVDRILWALEHAHEAGIIHRDMKASNVMVTDTGTVKVLDFGIARVRGAERLTVDGSMIGTPAYMAPEQVLGEGVDERADLYSVGVIFYRLLTGALPFTVDTPIAMLQKQVLDEPAPLDRHCRDLPDWCAAVVRRALAKSPGDRFQTAKEFREALDRATGLGTTDRAKTLAIRARQDVRARPDPARRSPPASPPSEAAIPPTASTRRIIVPRGSPAANGGALTLRWNRPAVIGSVLGLAVVMAAVLAQGTLLRLATVRAARTLPPLAFDAKVLDTGGSRLLDAQLILADGRITILASGAAEALHDVPYERLASISQSLSRDPMWNSPEGPARVARAPDGGLLRSLGISVNRARHWISLRTAAGDLIALQVSSELVERATAALAERTGREPVVVR